jgi:hypothetical protein
VFGSREEAPVSLSETGGGKWFEGQCAGSATFATVRSILSETGCLMGLWLRILVILLRKVALISFVEIIKY